jgi:hypothetical protein
MPEPTPDNGDPDNGDLVPTPVDGGDTEPDRGPDDPVRPPASGRESPEPLPPLGSPTRPPSGGVADRRRDDELVPDCPEPEPVGESKLAPPSPEPVTGCSGVPPVVDGVRSEPEPSAPGNLLSDVG